VQGVLAARIDRLPADVKQLLQALSVIGREFPLSLIRAVLARSDDELSRMLNDLQTGEFIYEQPAAGDVEYTFKHALTRDVAYNSLLTERRKLLHQHTGQAIETLYVDRLDDHLTELTHHFDTGGNVAKAVEYLSRSGSKTAKQGSHSEAIGHFTRALELLRGLSEGAVRDRHEFDLQMALNWSLFVARGRRAPEFEHTLVRARELAEHLGDNGRLMTVLVRLSYLRWSSNDFEPARELAERVMVIAQQAEAPAMLAGAHHALALIRFVEGEFPEAREHFLRAVELSGPGPLDNFTAFLAQNSPNILRATQMFLGYPSALSRADELLAAARRSSDPHAMAVQLFNDCMFHLNLRDTRMVAERADELRAIAVEHEMRAHLQSATFFRGWAIAAAGRVEEGIAEMGRTMSDPPATLVAGMVSSVMLSALAETCGKHGRVSTGLGWVAKGLAAADESGVRTYEAELHRIKGELLLIKDTGDVVEAECCLRKAIDVARRQSARQLELRATISLARLLKQQGKTDEARLILTEIYNWFTEGFDTADLKDAKALLQELST
jgi:tetratricopeptide (TPR) repeat protein